MTRPLAPVVLLLVVAACSATGVPGPGDAGQRSDVRPLRQLFSPGSIAVLHASVVEPETGERTEGQTILVSADRIVAVAADGTLTLPPGTISIDAAGRTVLPGLVDSHVHARSADLAR